MRTHHIDAETEIRARIVKRGKIPFAEFMEIALYHPWGGYYTSASAFGAAGDYFTSPAAHPIFGALIAVQLLGMWRALDSPARFYVVEMGAGNGLLARDVIDYAECLPGAFAQSMRYIELDRYALMDTAVAPPADAARIVTDRIPLDGVIGCFISNEFVDSFPVHRFQTHVGGVSEVYVTLDEGSQLAETLDVPSTPALVQRLRDIGQSLPDGFRGEVSIGIGSWIREVSTALERGFVITIDYGYTASELYAQERAGGTLQTYYRHTQGGSPYRRIGRQDITSHVDFSLVSSEGSEVGLRTLALVTQESFLRSMGFNGMAERLRRQRLGSREHQSNTMAMLELVKADGLGGFKVLVQERGTGIEDFSRLTPDGSLADIPRIPLLSDEHMPLMEGRYPHLAWEFTDLWPQGDEGRGEG